MLQTSTKLHADCLIASSIQPVFPAGHWDIGGTLLEVRIKVTPEQIANTEALLGWKWIPYKKPGSATL